LERRLTTILSIDVVGYSRLMGEDEAGTLAALKTLRRDLIDPKARQYHGRTVKLMGDGALMEFASVVDAVSFATELQMARRQAGKPPPHPQVQFRIGVNIGDIIVDGDDIYGNGVNLAARLTTLCSEIGEPAVLSSAVARASGLHVESLGRHSLKGIAEPEEVFRLFGTPAILSLPDVIDLE